MRKRTRVTTLIDHTYRDARFSHKSAFDALPEYRRTCTGGYMITATAYTLPSKVKGLRLSCGCAVALKVNLPSPLSCVDALADFWDAHEQHARVKRRVPEPMMSPELPEPVMSHEPVMSPEPVMSHEPVKSSETESQAQYVWSVYTDEKVLLEIENDFDFDVGELLSLGDTFAAELSRQNKAEDVS